MDRRMWLDWFEAADIAARRRQRWEDRRAAAFFWLVIVPVLAASLVWRMVAKVLNRVSP